MEPITNGHQPNEPVDIETREWVDRELTWDGGWTVIRRYERARVCGPWREVPNAD